MSQFFPEIKVCTNQNKKAFIIIRVPESDITPHRVGNDSKVYIRTGEINTATDKLDKSINEARWGKIEWLISKRNKSIELRNHMIEEADAFYKESFYKYGIVPEKYHGIVTFRILPLFPQGQLFRIEDFRKIENVIRVGQGDDWYPKYPYLTTLETVQNGLQILYFTRTEEKIPKQYELFFFIHLTNLGMYMYKWDAGTVTPHTDSEGNKTFEDKGLTYLQLIATDLYQYLSSALNYYKHLGFWGTLQFETEFDNVLGLKQPNLHEHLRIPRNHMKWGRTFMVSELENRKKEIVTDIISDIAWSIGIRNDFKETIVDYLNKENFQY